MSKNLFISVIIPVYNASQYLDKCLASIETSSYHSYEIIVVDDGSTDDSAKLAHKRGVKTLKLSEQSGPAAARNYASKEAKGDVIFFIDADVTIQPGTVARLVKDFNKRSDIAAVFGSYDDSPEEQNFFSQYMNLRHHFVHQESNPEAVTFWSGCGAIRKDIFKLMDGFDEKKYSRPCIEDIELGFRLKKMGYQILLDKELQVKHLKKWSFISVVRTDIVQRAIPWSKLILESKEMIRDLNLQLSQKVSTALVGLIIVIFVLSFFVPELIFMAVFLSASIMIINHKLLAFFVKRKGLTFSLLAFIMYLLYYLYSGVTYVSCWILYKLRN